MASELAAGVGERYRRGGLWIAVMVMGLWHLVSTLPVVISGWLGEGLAPSGAVIWLAYAIAGAVSAVIVLRGGGHGAALPLAVCPVLLAGVAVAPFLVRTGFFDYYDWPFSVSGWFALVALWHRRLRDLIAYFLASTVTGLAALIALGQADRLSLARFAVVCCGVCVLQVTVYAGSGAVAATARQLAEAESAAARIRTARLAAEAVQSARRLRYEALRETVTELLEGLAAGTLDPGQPDPRQRLAVAVTRLRTYSPARGDSGDPLWLDLEACADAAQRKGVAVDLIRPAGTIPLLPADVRRALTEPVAQALAVPPASARVTVVASPAQVTLAVISDAGVTAPMWATHPDVRVDYDSREGRLWVQARWNAA